MSLSRARKKFIRSLTRKKKLKISEPKEVGSLPFLLSRSPLPSCTSPMFSPEDPHDHFQSSMSLPDQLDSPGAMNVTKISSKSLSCIDTVTTSIRTPQLAGDTNSNSNLFNDTKSTPSLLSLASYSKEGTTVTHESYQRRLRRAESLNSSPKATPHKENISTARRPNEIFIENLALQSSHFETTRSISKNQYRSHSNSDNFDKVTRHSISNSDNFDKITRHSVSNSDNFDKVTRHSISNNLHCILQETRNDLSPLNSASTLDTSSENLGKNNDQYSHHSDYFTNTIGNSQASLRNNENTYSESKYFLEELQELEDSTGEDEVFNPDPSFLSKSENSFFDSRRDPNLFVSANNLQEESKERSSKINRDIDSKEHTNPSIHPVFNSDPEIIGCLKSLQNSSEIDSSFLKKIHFFENYNGFKNQYGTNDAVAFSDTYTRKYGSSTELIKRASSLKQSNTASKYSSSENEENVTSFKKNVTQDKSGSNSRMSSTRSAAPRQRLNFSRFRRSDSIPEVVSACSCGGFCDGSCHDSPLEVCHHQQCTDVNGDWPLMLCAECDLDIHELPQNNDHFVLDLKIKAENRTLNNTGHVASEQAPCGVDNSVYTKYEDTNSDDQERSRENAMNGVLVEAISQNASTFYFNTNEKLEDVQALDSSRTEVSEHATERTALASLNQSKRRSVAPGNDAYFTLKFVNFLNTVVELVDVSVGPSRTLRDALGPVLKGRNVDINAINVFIEKSQTPLPMDGNTFFLAEKTLEVKEKEKGLDSFNSGLPRQSISVSKKDRAPLLTQQTSRRESVGVATLLHEPLPTKQRRGSLQLPFREHFFTKTDFKINEGLKVFEENIGNLQGRQSWNSSNDDGVYSPSTSQAPSSTIKRKKSTKHVKYSNTNKDKEKHEQFVEILKQYSLHESTSGSKLEDNMLDMEPSWRLIVSNHENLTKKQHEHQEAVWELLLTEVSYIKQIRVIIDVFQNSLINVQKESYLNEIEVERLFSNIDKVFECNCTFWKLYLLPVLQHSRKTGQPLDPLISKEGFIEHFPEMFQVYFKYFIEHKACVEYAKVSSESRDLFKIFINWAEAQNQCNRLRLADILVQPMPRLLKYSLLLKAILKYTEDDQDKTDLQAMVRSVDRLCRTANSTLRRKEEYTRLETVSRTVEPFDALEAPNDECAKIIQEYACNFNLSSPMPGFSDGPRSLLYQSNLKMKEGQNAKIDVDCLLFTDLLLICKSNKKMERFKIIRPPMRLDQLIVNELKDKACFLLIYVNEYLVPISAFTFHSDAGAIRVWLDKFRQAQKEFKEMEIKKNASKDRLRSDTASTLDDLDTMSMVSLPSYLESITLPRSGSEDSIDRFLPNLVTSDSSSSTSEFARHSDGLFFRSHLTDIPTDTSLPFRSHLTDIPTDTSLPFRSHLTDIPTDTSLPFRSHLTDIPTDTSLPFRSHLTDIPTDTSLPFRSHLTDIPSDTQHPATDFKNVDYSSSKYQETSNETMHENHHKKQKHIQMLLPDENNTNNGINTPTDLSSKYETKQNNSHEFIEKKKKIKKFPISQIILQVVIILTNKVITVTRMIFQK